jgi:membrane-associated phospholipid phosphatase
LPRKILLFISLIASCFVAFSQEITPASIVDSIPGTRSPEITAKPLITWRSVIIPATMITYGVVAIKFDGFQDWNEAIKDEIWTKQPHQLIHIDNYLQWAPAASTFALGFAGIKGRHNFTDRALIFGMAELIQSSVVASVKKISGEWRPNGESNQSFPSGHTANAFTGAEFMRLEYKDVSPWYGVYGYVLAASTGVLRMYNNKHWLSDVVAAAGVGILSTDFTYFIYPKIKRLFTPKHNSNAIILPTYNNGVFGISMVKRF